ncbi:MAG: substrate-binding domain-containing protein [Roseiflexaceae bacterium]|nr:substrate-binding domain-containing protein [Roseiflexaceae bacterium]
MNTRTPRWGLVTIIAGTLLASCGAAPAATTGTNPVPAATAAPAAATDRYQVALVLGQMSDSFYTSMQCGAQEAANRLGNVDLVVQGPAKWDASLQTPIVNALVASQVDAIAIAVNDGKALYAPLKTANDAGIKVIGVDTKLEDSSFVVTNISSDNTALGVEAAKTLATLMGDKGTALTSAVPPGVSTVGERVQGFLDEMKNNHPNIKVVYLGVNPGDSIDAVVAAFNGSFTANPDLTGVFSVSNNESEAAATAIRGLPADMQQNIKVVSFDAGEALVEALKAGKLQALVAQKPAEMGAQAVESAVKALKGETVEKNIPTGGVGITADNVTTPEFSQFVYKSKC